MAGPAHLEGQLKLSPQSADWCGSPISACLPPLLLLLLPVPGNVERRKVLSHPVEVIEAGSSSGKGDHIWCATSGVLGKPCVCGLPFRSQDEQFSFCKYVWEPCTLGRQDAPSCSRQPIVLNIWVDSHPFRHQLDHDLLSFSNVAVLHTFRLGSGPTYTVVMLTFLSR